MEQTVQLRRPFVFRLCGDFAMLHRMVGFTGSGSDVSMLHHMFGVTGSDLHRCPYQWPCVPRRRVPCHR